MADEGGYGKVLGKSDAGMGRVMRMLGMVK